MKSVKTKNWHTGNSPKRTGESYGVGVKQKQGKVVSSYLQGKTPKFINKPPKSLA